LHILAEMRRKREEKRGKGKRKKKEGGRKIREMILGAVTLLRRGSDLLAVFPPCEEGEKPLFFHLLGHQALLGMPAGEEKGRKEGCLFGSFLTANLGGKEKASSFRILIDVGWKASLCSSHRWRGRKNELVHSARRPDARRKGGGKGDLIIAHLYPARKERGKKKRSDSMILALW